MKLLEWQGKHLLRQVGIPVAHGQVVENMDELMNLTLDGGKMVVKAQVPVGGRGKAGGIKLASDPQQIREYAMGMLGSTLKGFPVESVLIEEALDIAEEMYLSILYQPSGEYLLLFTESGGMEIEEVAETTPEKIAKFYFLPQMATAEYYFMNVLRKAGLQGSKLKAVSEVAWKLYKAIVKYDLLLAEINPLAILVDGRAMAADAKVEVDDNALFRQPMVRQWVKPPSDEMERLAKEIGVTFVDLGGDIGIVASGAGLAMATMDLVRDMNYAPGNFLETGGGITDKLIAGSVGLVCSKDRVKGLIVNLYGGVNSLTAAAKGVVEGVAELPRKIPVVVKAQGNQQEECWRILEDAGIPVVKTHRTEDAVRLLVDKLEGIAV